MKTVNEIAMSLAPTRAEALAEKIERSQFGIGLSSVEIAMVVLALRQSVLPEAIVSREARDVANEIAANAGTSYAERVLAREVLRIYDKERVKNAAPGMPAESGVLNQSPVAAPCVCACPDDCQEAGECLRAMGVVK